MFSSFNRVKILANNLCHNFQIFSQNSPEKAIFPTIKSNAYGHGAREVASILQKFRSPFFAVHAPFEAMELSEFPILVLGPSLPQDFSNFCGKNIAVSVASVENLRIFSESKIPFTLHLKCNTGMNRQGFDFSDLAEVFEILRRSPHLTVGGVFSHFADADNSGNHGTERQNSIFSAFLDAVFTEKYSPQWIHLGNSAGVLKTRDPRINAMRTGIGLCGINPLESCDEHFSKLQELKPVMRVLSTITNIRTLEEGEAVSYNGTFVAPQKMRIGVVPFGYYEGLDRGFSNAGFFKIGNRIAKILGRVCMNLTVFEVSENEKIGDEVIILSENPEDQNSAKNMAKEIGTIPYEVFTRISPFLPRTILS